MMFSGVRTCDSRGASRRTRIRFGGAQDRLQSPRFTVALYSFHVSANVCCMLIAKVSIFFQRLVDDLLKLRGKLRVEVGSWQWLTVQNRIVNRRFRLTAERLLPGGHLVHNYAEGEQVRTAVELLTPCLLRRHVPNGS